jgi:NAD(P)-dependent dehydrogenase (short-subunit alcohol dehydrogenase family)
MRAFGFESTTDDVLEGISLAGKTVLVTGATAGLGIETSRALAAAGATVVMLGRNQAVLEQEAEALRGLSLPGQIATLSIDLASLDSVREAADAILESYPRIDILINNAGVMACPLMRTTDGFEMQFGTNHLGHFLLTCLITPALLAGAPARIINLSSSGHKFSDVNLDDPNYEQRDYEKWAAYGESKTANALFSVGLDQRLKSRGVRSLAVHPGVIMTKLSRHLTEADIENLMNSAPKGESLDWKSVEQGAATSVWAATAPELADKGALFLENCQVAVPAEPGKGGGVEDYALDPAGAERLWALSEQLVGQRFAL